MSVDEVAWQKWHRYVTNVVDIEKPKVIWNHNGRGKVILGRFYHTIGSENCEKITGVADLRSTQTTNPVIHSIGKIDINHISRKPIPGLDQALLLIQRTIPLRDLCRRSGVALAAQNPGITVLP